MPLPWEANPTYILLTPDLFQHLPIGITSALSSSLFPLIQDERKSIYHVF